MNFLTKNSKIIYLTYGILLGCLFLAALYFAELVKGGDSEQYLAEDIVDIDRTEHA